MHLNIVPARNGFAWARSGVRIFWQQPMAMFTLFCPLAGLQIVSAALPLPVAFLLQVLIPTVTLGMMVAAREVLAGRKARPHMLVAGLRAGPAYARPMLLLGGYYALTMLLLYGLTTVASSLWGAEAQVKLPVAAEDAARLLSSELGKMALTAVFYLPVSMMFWHAPALVFWYRIHPAKSLFFSFVACLRNVPAFTLYTLAWVGISAIGIFAVAIAATLVLATGVLGSPTGKIGMAFGALLTIGSALSLVAMFFASLYATFLDCFILPSVPGALSTDIPEPTDAPPPPPDGSA